MKYRHLLLALPLVLGGCATLLTGGVNNPLTPKIALTLHASFDAGVVVAAGDYAYLPRCPAPQPCSQQAVVNKLRSYINPAEATLTKLDQWAEGNSTLNGVSLYQAAILAIQTAQTYASSNGLTFTPATGT